MLSESVLSSLKMLAEFLHVEYHSRPIIMDERSHHGSVVSSAFLLNDGLQARPGPDDVDETRKRANANATRNKKREDGRRGRPPSNALGLAKRMRLI